MVECIANLVTKLENVVGVIAGSRYGFGIEMFAASVDANDGKARNVASGKETLASTRDVRVCNVDLPCEVPVVTERGTIQ